MATDMAAGESEFVTPQTVRLALAPSPAGRARWVEVKRELTYGEEQELAARSLRPDSAEIGKGLAVDLAGYQINRLLAWLVDWSFRDPQDRAVPVSRAAIAALAPRVAAELNAALDRHIEALEQEKKVLSGASAPPSTSA